MGLLLGISPGRLGFGRLAAEDENEARARVHVHGGCAGGELWVGRFGGCLGALGGCLGGVFVRKKGFKWQMLSC